MPIVRPDAGRTMPGATIEIAVLSNDEGSNLRVIGYTQPTAGTLALNPDQSFSYTASAQFEGVDGFAYTVRDGIGGTAEGDVRIVVARHNTPPAAQSDATSVMAGASVEIPVMANDNDSEGDPLAIIGIDAPSGGTISVLSNQAIRYTPQPGFEGIDSFTYTVGDGQGGAATANVTVVVNIPNASPQARPDHATTLEGEPVTIDVLANDNDPEGGPVSLSGINMPGHGTLTLTPDHRFVYAPAEGFVGTDSFSYDIRDREGAGATAKRYCGGGTAERSTGGRRRYGSQHRAGGHARPPRQ
jgi:hypothetical protein